MNFRDLLRACETGEIKNMPITPEMFALVETEGARILSELDAVIDEVKPSTLSTGPGPTGTITYYYTNPWAQAFAAEYAATERDRKASDANFLKALGIAPLDT